MASCTILWGDFVAVLALIQPWVVAIWRKYCRPGAIDIFETGTIEVGYTTFGPTLGLHGTLRARDRDLFVRSAHVELVKCKDQSRHQFEWGVFRSPRIALGKPEDLSLELPAGFMVLTSQPHRYSIQFHDMKIQEEIRSVLEPVSRKWGEIVARQRATVPPKETTDLAAWFSSVGAMLSTKNQAAFEEFSKTPEFTDALTRIDRLCYWERGDYELLLIIRTARPDRQFQHKWWFALSESDERGLHLNPFGILLQVCGQPTGQYYFAYARYKEARDKQASSANCGPQ